jgi:hypothetical protein
MATSMMIQSAASIGSASLQTCSKGRVEAHCHTAYCVGILAVTYISSGLWISMRAPMLWPPGLFTSSQNLFLELLHPCLEMSLIHNLRVSTHWGTWFHVFPASCSYAPRSLAVTVESNHAVSVLYDQMPWHLISRMSHACCTGRV